MDFTDLSPGHVAVLQTALPLVALLVLGVLARGIPRVLLVTQSIFWFLAYVPRPLLLLAVTPQPTFGDDLADPRLAVTGYDYNVAHVLAPVATGLWIYVALVAVFVVWQRMTPNGQRVLQQQSSTTVATLVAVWLGGAVVRAYSYLTGQAATAGQVTAGNPYLTFLTDAGAIGAIGVIVYLRLASPRLTVAVIACAMGGELVWGMAEQSKTPFIGAVLAMVVRLSATKLTRSRVMAIVAAGVGVGAIFGWLQSFKVDAATEQATAGADAAYPAAIQPLLSIMRRFDLFAASTDSYFLDGRPYLSVHDVWTRILLNCIPQQLGVEKIQSGTDWAHRVRGSSVDMANVSVSLAEGHLNEGYAVHGYLGVALESVFVIAMIAAVSMALTSRSIPLIAIGLSFVSVPALFERGALGMSETLGKSLQQAALVSVLALAIWLMRELHARRRPSEGERHTMESASVHTSAETARKVLT